MTPRKSANERLQRPPAVPAMNRGEEIAEVDVPVDFNNNKKRSTFGASKISVVSREELEKYKERSTSKNFDSPNCICLR